MAHTYSHLYNLPTTGLRFFTVYGPWGRPDMALFKFTKNIIDDEKSRFTTMGKLRDFTFVDDVIKSIVIFLDKGLTNRDFDKSNPLPYKSWAPFHVFNVGNSKPIELMRYVNAIESFLDKKAKIEFLPMQPGDVQMTYADSELV